MLSFIQRHFREIHLLLTALLGLSLGALAAAGLGARLRPPLPAAQGPAQTQAAPARRPAPADYEVILRRNVFDSTAPAPSLALTEPAGQGPAAAAARPPLTLLGTVVAGARSLALIQSGQQTGLFHLEEEVPGGGRVEEITRRQVRIKYPDGGSVELPLYEGEPGQPQPAPPAAAGRTAVRPLGENRWVIPRAEAERARGNINELLKQARMEPNIVEGRTEGFVVRMVRADSLLALLGIQRGDILLQVNGMELDTPEKALQIFQQLREARHISVALRRGGTPMSFEYEVE